MTVSERAGWRAVSLENGRLRTTVLPGKGADIYELIDLQSGVDVLFKAPWGLQPPGTAPRAGSEGGEFLANYEGGWQELFPSAGDACSYRGRPIPFHGEVAALPWTYDVLTEDEDEVAVKFSVSCRQLPLRLDRTIRLRRDSPSVAVEETVSNESQERAQFVWGHHLVLGPPFIEAGCSLDLPVERIVTLPTAWEESARLRPGQASSWPMAHDRHGGLVDLRKVPGPETGSHDDVYLTDLSDGWISVHNPRLKLLFTMRFDHRLFRWIVSWQPYGGAREMPLAGSYALGVEPWTSGSNLEDSIRAGTAVELSGGESVETLVTVRIDRRE